MKNNIFIRKVRINDMEQIFNHSNQLYVRKQSIDKEKIEWKDHIFWFNNTIQDLNSVFFIVTDKTERYLGQIRYKIVKNKATVSISLSSLISGKGLSRHLLIESIDKLLIEKKGLSEIVAFVFKENIPSIKIFEKSGFLLCDKQNELLKYIYQVGEK